MRQNVATEPGAQKKAPPAAFSPKIKAKIVAKWRKITEGDVDAMNGSFSALSMKTQEAYSYPKVKAEKECEEFKRSNKLQ